MGKDGVTLVQPTWTDFVSTLRRGEDDDGERTGDNGIEIFDAKEEEKFPLIDLCGGIFVQSDLEDREPFLVLAGDSEHSPRFGTFQIGKLRSFLILGIQTIDGSEMFDDVGVDRSDVVHPLYHLLIRAAVEDVDTIGAVQTKRIRPTIFLIDFDGLALGQRNHTVDEIWVLR